MKKSLTLIPLLLITLTLSISVTSCDQQAKQKEFTRADLVNLVKRSYQYVAMYNVVNNFALQEGSILSTHGWNKTLKNTTLADHTVKAIARPNNDTYYIISTLDLRDDAVVVSYPAFDTKFACLEVSGYDHYVEIPLATSKGDFREPRTVLYYSDHTKNYHGEQIEGVDTVLKMTSDFVVAFLRLMPHISDPERNARIREQVKALTLKTLSEFQGKPAIKASPVKFPAWKNDPFVFKNDFPEVMQFVFNHVSFDADDEMDRAVLAAFRPLGIVPGREYDSSKVHAPDGTVLAQIADSIARASLAIWNSPDNPYLMKVFQPKGKMTLEAMVVQSAVGPIGLPATQAIYPGISTADGKPLNAMHDYVISMPTKADLPPAKAFWSVTLYNAANGYFIPNDRHKYVVGENSGMKLNDQGGIEIYIAAEQPKGVPEENWLPIQREDINLDLIMRIYVPDWDRMKSWKKPAARIIK